MHPTPATSPPSRPPGSPTVGPEGPRKGRRFELRPDAPPVAPPLPPGTGPLRPQPTASIPHATRVRAPDLVRSLQDQGVLSLQLREQGRGSEVRLRIQHPEGVIEASLRQGRGAGLEIHLAGNADQEPLLARIAETLEQRLGGRNLDEISVGSEPLSDRDDPRHRKRGAPRSDPESQVGRRRRCPPRAAVTARALGHADYVT